MSQRSNTPQGRRRRAPSKQIRHLSKIDPALQLRPAFKGQVVQAMKISGIPVKFDSAVTTGLIDLALAVGPNSIENFAQRFGDLFEEYRIVKARFSTRLFSSINTGLLVSWVDEKDFNAPTLAQSRTKSNLKDVFNASAVDTKPNLTWTPHDTVDQQYQDIGSTATLASFKLYSDSSNYGTSIVATPYGEVFPVFTVQFRGMK